MTGILHQEGTAPIAQYGYAYDAMGNRISMTDSRTDSTTTYGYDDANRLIMVGLQKEGQTAPSRISEYSYDAAGNRTREYRINVGTSLYHYNIDDELLKISMPDHYEMIYTYSEDGRGNLESAHFSGHGIYYTTGEYEYNVRNQEVRANSLVNYTYNHNGQRISATVNGQTINYLWDEYSRYGDVVLESNSNANYLRSYNLANGMLINQTTLTDDPATVEIENELVPAYFLGDEQNSTRALVDEEGDVTAEYDYDAFGKLTSNINYDENGEIIENSADTFATNYLYTGQQFDSATELYNLRARIYDPSIGRFQSRDTWAYNLFNPFELNRYVYGANNPLMYIDPSGYAGTADNTITFSKVSFRTTKVGIPFGLSVQAAYNIVVITLLLMIAGAIAWGVYNGAIAIPVPGIPRPGVDVPSDVCKNGGWQYPSFTDKKFVSNIALQIAQD